ncbi:MAG TPA: hypothetical protein VIC34_10735 [Croceibacterium sp.]|jgi:hypothetical protein
MTVLGFLPQRWRPSERIARHSEGIAGVLYTAPVKQAAGGPTVVSLIGTVDVLPYLVTIKSLFLRLGRGRIAIVDDGTLTGEDRAILAHHCGDPEIIPHQAGRRPRFPAGGAWALLLTVLERRTGQYWVVLDPHTVTLAPLPEVDAALASNRSFSLGEGWTGIAGFAAGAASRTLTASLADPGEPVAADAAARFILANEPETVDLPRKRFAIWNGRARHEGAALIHFPIRHRFSGGGYATASATALAALSR